MNITNIADHPLFDPLLSKKQVSAWLGVHPSTIDRWMADNLFVPKICLSPNRVGYRKSDVEAWIAERREDRSGDR